MRNKPLKIAMIGLRGIGGELSGGVERHVEELTVRMAEAGHDVTVHCRKRYSSPGLTKYKGVRLKRYPAIYSKHLETISHTAIVMPDAVRPSRLGGYDIVHFHATGSALFAWLPRLLGRRVVVTVHGLDFLRAKWGRFASLFLRAGAWSAAHFPHETIVVSRTLREYYRNNKGRETRWLPNGVARPVTRPLDRLARFGLLPNEYVLSLGRLVPEKGIHLLIRAFAKTEARLRLVIAGDNQLDSNYADSLRQEAVTDPRIVFSGPLYGEEKDEAFSNARLFVLPSDLEGMPITLLESLSHGCPVLSSDIPECLEIREKAASHGYSDIFTTFQRGDEAGLRTALDSLLRNPALREKAAVGREHVLAMYNWDAITRATLDIYAHALGNREDSS